MTEIIKILQDYRGEGILLLLYLAAFLYLLLRERDPVRRALFVYMPATILVLFLLPPFYAIYSKVETATYYRLLWLLPMGATLAYAGLRLFGRHYRIGLILLCALVIAGGSYTYSNPNITKAQNRYHIPQSVINLCDFLKIQSGGKRVRAAIPGELAQYIRQYDTDVEMPFGREMLVPQWDYYNEVYEVMEKPEVIDAQALVEATRNQDCRYIVLSSLRAIDRDLTELGLEQIGLIDGFYVYEDDTVPEQAD
ncbi:MAG: hypothetical protein Q4C60_02585 [Eubacteriales bacterium]|nr:hypothetical protein [Eubacteriales bacterium]